MPAGLKRALEAEALSRHEAGAGFQAQSSVPAGKAGKGPHGPGSGILSGLGTGEGSLQAESCLEK